MFKSETEIMSQFFISALDFLSNSHVEVYVEVLEFK